MTGQTVLGLLSHGCEFGRPIRLENTQSYSSLQHFPFPLTTPTEPPSSILHPAYSTFAQDPPLPNLQSPDPCTRISHRDKPATPNLG